MPALRKPHRIAVVIPELGLEGSDVAYEREAALLLWIALIETCQRHPGLATYDPESTPLVALDGHFIPQHAHRGASPVDQFYAPARRDELVWLEVPLSKPGAVRLHTLSRDGTKQSFDALGKNVGEQINQVLGSWLGARGLGVLPRRFDAVTGDEILAVVRVMGPVLVEQARSWTAPIITIPELADDDDDEPGDPDANTSMREILSRPGIGRALSQRLPATLKVSALRVLELALNEELDDVIIALDREHPQSLFARFLLTSTVEPDFALLRRVIAASPGWARPYAYLISSRRNTADAFDDLVRPTRLEQTAGAGIAALIRPANLDILDTAADRLRDDDRVDDAVRLLERATTLYPEDPRSHLFLLHAYAHTDRIGAWLDQAHLSSRLHGCPMDPGLPWYPDQILVDLHVSDSLLDAGRLDEAIALRANRLEGRAAEWPRHARILDSWRKDPRFVAWCYGREGYFRGDEARAVEAFGRIEPADSVDLAIFLDALVATGREADAVLAWAQFGLGRGFTAPIARLAAARALMAAGDWRRGIDEMWRVELAEPGRDDDVAISRCGLLMSCGPIDVFEAALAERVAMGSRTLARRMARDIADFVPGALKSGVVQRALGKTQPIETDLGWLDGFAADTRGREAIDELFHSIASGKASELVLSDRLVARWLEVAFSQAPADDPAALVQAAAYTAAHAVSAYLAQTTKPPSVFAGAYRSVAAEALALVRKHRHVLTDRDARAIVGAMEPVIRRVDRWIAASWLALVERSCGLDERASGDVAGFLREHATCSARILGPEEGAVLAASVTRLHRERPGGWATAVASQASRLATHTGRAGVDEWADAIVQVLEMREIEQDEAVDALLTTCYLAEGRSAHPALLAAKTLFAAGRGSAAFTILCGGLADADPATRDAALAKLAPAWKAGKLDVPIEFDKTAAQMFEALQKGDPARGEKLGRWAVAVDPRNAEANRNLGLALAQQGKIVDALHYLARGAREESTQILSGVLYQANRMPDALDILDYASRWYSRADQWLTFGGIAYAAMDNPRSIKGYQIAYRLDPDSFDESQLNAYAGVLDEVADYATCEKIARHLLTKAGDDLAWKTNAWNHLACAFIGKGNFDEAIRYAEMAVEQNPNPDNTGPFGDTLARAKQKSRPTRPVASPPSDPSREVQSLLDGGAPGDVANKLTDPSWRVRRAALHASRYRFSSENHVAVTPRAIAASTAILVDSTGSTDRDVILARMLALQIREQAYFARDPMPRLGDRMTREAFYAEFRARGGVVITDDAPKPAGFVDRSVVPTSKISNLSDYVSLLRDLAALTPKEALAQFDLDDVGYLEVARAWAQAMDKDPSIAKAIAVGLAKR